MQLIIKEKFSGNSKIPDTQWDDIGAMKDIKQEVYDTVILPQKCPYLFDDLIRPRTGVLFYGPPGNEEGRRNNFW